MNRISRIIRSDRSRSSDEGFTLVEVIVAMIVFSIISLTVAGSITNSLVITKDSRSRIQAVNLASQDLDALRAVTDVLSITNKTWPVTVQGTTYTIKREVSFATSSTTADACGTGASSLQYMVVKDTVSYSGAGTTNPVVSTTNLSPNSRLNDPNYGIIIVAVKGADGAGAAGVAVSISPASSNPNGAVATAAPALTNANGCSFVTKVTPGNYTVSISRANGIDYTQDVSPVTFTPNPVAVSAGTVTPVPFTFDTASTATLAYASNYTGSAYLPTNLDTTFVSDTGGVDTVQLGSSKTVPLFPFTSGYTYEAGAYVAPVVGDTGTVKNKPCVNVDPGAWTTANSSKKTGTSFAASNTPGGSTVTVTTGTAATTLRVPMGVVTLPSMLLAGTVTATAVNTTANGDPGCSTGNAYTFSLPSGTSSVALPFGTWSFSALLGLAKITPGSGSIKTGGVINPDGTVTLDPRGVTP
jgi:prepilin-type N-terminal cleavage/methylation domain-containing protein